MDDKCRYFFKRLVCALCTLYLSGVLYTCPSDAEALLQYTLDCQKYGDKEGNKKRHVKRCLAKR